MTMPAVQMAFFNTTLLYNEPPDCIPSTRPSRGLMNIPSRSTNYEHGLQHEKGKKTHPHPSLNRTSTCRPNSGGPSSDVKPSGMDMVQIECSEVHLLYLNDEVFFAANNVPLGKDIKLTDPRPGCYGTTVGCRTILRYCACVLMGGLSVVCRHDSDLTWMISKICWIVDRRALIVKSAPDKPFLQRPCARRGTRRRKYGSKKTIARTARPSGTE